MEEFLKGFIPDVDDLKILGNSDFKRDNDNDDEKEDLEVETLGSSLCRMTMRQRITWRK